MNSLKTMFLAVLMSAATYGVYVTITGNPPGSPPKETREWVEDPPQVERPEGDPSQTPAPQAATTAPAEMRRTVTENSDGPYGTGETTTYDPRGEVTGAESRRTETSPAPNRSETFDAPNALDRGAQGGTSPERYSPDSPDDRYPPRGRYGDADRRQPVGRDLENDRYPADERDRGHEGNPTADTRREGDPSPDGSPPPDPVEIHDEFVAGMREAEAMLAENHLVDGLMKLSRMVGDPLWSPQDEAQLMELLDQLAGTVIYSREHLLEPPYEVQPGDTLDRIAEAYHVPWQLLANINGISDSRRQLRPGDTLKVVKGPFEAWVDLGRFRLTLFVGDCYAGRFDIGIGKDFATPEGVFVVQKKIVNPDYYGKPYMAADDPNNPLGEYALELADHLYIHGTNDPASIGRADSKGCIRLNNRDIADLFAILSEKTERSPGSTVTIRRQ
ncbi:MAG TPA: L,D-transpeptidase family protein [Pirellulales bacterium]|nr:L,D-transpeptidase family protein [Pirellulales bacterium]